MKKLCYILTLVIAIIFTSCAKEEDLQTEASILPEAFSVDIPPSLSKSTIKSVKNGEEDYLQGNDIYEHLTTFIQVGDNAAEIVEAVIKAIRLYNLSEPKNFTYDGDDGRAKNVVIKAQSEFEGMVWNYQMTVTDADSEMNDDGGVAMQIFWNTGTVKGIAVMKPYNADQSNTKDIFMHAMYRIDYSEAAENGYEQEMTVYVSGITLPSPLTHPFAMETLKMTAGRNGDVVEVFGNSNHPNATLFSDETGFNWAFVAAGKFETDLGVAEVGLPPSNLNSIDREEILGQYSIHDVFMKEINDAHPGIDPTLLAIFLQNTGAPGYFNSQGFVSGGVSPNDKYNVLSATIETLVPYNPSEVSNLNLEFKVISAK